MSITRTQTWKEADTALRPRVGGRRHPFKPLLKLFPLLRSPRHCPFVFHPEVEGKALNLYPDPVYDATCGMLRLSIRAGDVGGYALRFVSGGGGKPWACRDANVQGPAEVVNFINASLREADWPRRRRKPAVAAGPA